MSTPLELLERAEQDEHDRVSAIWTYRTLRLGMIALVAMLAASLLQEAHRNTWKWCWQTSISAYYFTPARAVFIAALCALGACLIMYRGDSDLEDSLLNVSGSLAFLVAMVPTGVSLDDPDGGKLAALIKKTCVGDAAGLDKLREQVDASSAPVAQNVLSVLAMGAIGFAIFWLLRRLRRKDMPEPVPHSRDLGYDTRSKCLWPILWVVSSALWVVRDKRVVDRVGFPVAFALIVWAAVSGGEPTVHSIAAPAMFALIAVVMAMHVAYSTKDERLAAALENDERRKIEHRKANVYLAIFTVMFVALLVAVGFHKKMGGEHQVLWAEIIVLLCFAVFWGFQTAFGWKQESRRLGTPSPVPGRAT